DTRTTPPMRHAHLSLLAPLLCLLAALPGTLAAATGCRAPAAVCESRSAGALALIERGTPVQVLVEEDDFKAVHRAAEALRGDLEAVSGADAAATATRTAIIAGTLEIGRAHV